MKRIIRRIVTLCVFAALLGTGYYFGRSYIFPIADRRAIHVVGMIEAPEVNVTSRIAGRIKELKLLEGDRVEKGEVVCVIEDTDLRNLLAKARADEAHSRADLDDARRNVNRINRLFAKGVVSTKDRDDALTRVEQTEAALASAQANVGYYSDQLTDTRIRSPLDGTVVNKALEEGEWVTPGAPILTVDDLSTIWARVDVQETDLGSIHVGKPATVTLPTDPPTVLRGEVMAVGQEAQFATERDVRRGRQDIRTFYVKVRVLQAEGNVKPGMTAEVSFARGDGKLASRNLGRGPY